MNKTSKVRGVCFDKHSNKYRAYITFMKKTTYLGFYTNESDAVKARTDAERYYRIDFSKPHPLYKHLSLSPTLKLSKALLIECLRTYVGDVPYFQYAINYIKKYCEKEPSEGLIGLTDEDIERKSSQYDKISDKYIRDYIEGVPIQILSTRYQLSTSVIYRGIKSFKQTL